MHKKNVRAPNRLYSRSQSQGNNKKRSKILFSLLFVVLVAFFITFGFYIYSFLSVKPHDSLSAQAKTLLAIPRDDLESTLIVFEDSENESIDGAWYIVHNKKNAFTMVYSIPRGVYMMDYLKSVSSFVSVGELLYVGNRINQKRDYEYAIWQLGNLTGMTPDSYIWFNLNSLKSAKETFGNYSNFNKSKFLNSYSDDKDVSNEALTMSSFFDKYSFLKLFLCFNNYKTILNGVDTNLNTIELLARMRSLKEVLEQNDIFMMDLNQSWATVPKKQVSGKDINVINYSEVDQRLSNIVKNLKGRELEREQVKIEIYNASNVEGLALRYSRKFQNSGIEVVRYENSPTDEEITKIYVPKPELYVKSLELVKKLLAINPQIIQKRPDYMTTGDIVVVLGKDVGNMVGWK